MTGYKIITTQQQLQLKASHVYKLSHNLSKQEKFMVTVFSFIHILQPFLQISWKNSFHNDSSLSQPVSLDQKDWLRESSCIFLPCILRSNIHWTIIWFVWMNAVWASNFQIYFIVSFKVALWRSNEWPVGLKQWNT